MGAGQVSAPRLLHTLAALTLVTAAAAAGAGCGGKTDAVTPTATAPSAAMLSGPILPIDCSGVFKSRPQCQAINHTTTATTVACVPDKDPRPPEDTTDPTWRSSTPQRSTRHDGDGRGCPPGTTAVRSDNSGE